MKWHFLIGFVLFSGSTWAQLPDDVTDTRKKNESVLKLPKGDMRSELAYFTMAGIDESMGKSPLVKVPFSDVGPDFMTFKGTNISATVTTAPFVPAKHKLDYDEKYLIKIDRKPYYGGYGFIPKTVINKVTMVVNRDTISIPPVAYSDLYNLNFSYLNKGTQKSTNGIYRSSDGDRLYLYIFCKDKTGSYEVTWVFVNRRYARRIIDYGFM